MPRAAHSSRATAGWQNGNDPITVPDTMAGSPHTGIEFECWKCGSAKVHGNQIHRVKQTSVWTNTHKIDGCTVRSKQSYNKFKKCNVQSVECTRCHETLGSYYESPYIDSDTGRVKEGQVFPCFKLDHLRRKSEPGESTQFSLVLTGRKVEVQAAIEALVKTEDADAVGEFARYGRVDALTFELFKKHKSNLRETAELRLVAEQEAAAAKRDAEREAQEKRRRAEQEATAAKRAAERDAQEKRRRAEQEASELKRAALDEAARHKLEVESAAAEKIAAAQRLFDEAENKLQQADTVEQEARTTAERHRAAAKTAAFEAAKTTEQSVALRRAAETEAAETCKRAAAEATLRRNEAEALVAQAKDMQREAESEQQEARDALARAKKTEREISNALVAPLPSYWAPHLSVDATRVVDVTATMRERVEWLMNAHAQPETHGTGRDSHGLHFTRFKVVSVERIESLRMWQAYATKRAHVNAVPEGEVRKDVLTTAIRMPYVIVNTSLC
jgi:hypothetical protein